MTTKLLGNCNKMKIQNKKVTRNYRGNTECKIPSCVLVYVNKQQITHYKNTHIKQNTQ